ncbi:unnamed protein product [Rotaria socialis]|uniref:Uncharacterized protein n=1 Tax=Rotaria socialis TaxID=392032 RepID=A0A820X5D4_9BILA|nr:unnamed protein product [Rotaria socialis]
MATVSNNDVICALEVTFDKEKITAEQVTRAESYMMCHEMQLNIMRNVSRAGANLLSWVRAMYLYGQITAPNDLLVFILKLFFSLSETFVLHAFTSTSKEVLKRGINLQQT